MKFGEQIITHLTPEWRKQYVQYETLKKLLYDPLSNAPDANLDPENYAQHISKADLYFMGQIEEQLTTINLFFSMKIADAHRKYHEMQHDLEDFKKETKEKKSLTKSVQQMKFAFSEFYLSLVLIQNFQQLNQTGFRKILKKHDKLFKMVNGKQFFTEKVQQSNFVTNKDVEHLLAKTETIVINDLEGGNRSAAMKRLRVQPMSEKQSAWTTFRLGLYLGAFILSVFIITFTVSAGFYTDQQDDDFGFSLNQTLADDQFYIDNYPRARERKWVGARLFRGFLLLFINCWLLGLNVYGWQGAGVNHILIFEINPRDHLTYQSMMEIASLLCLIWSLTVIGYLYAHVINVPPLVFPLILMAICILYMFNPINVMHKSSRYWLLRKTFLCLTAPFHAVAFADFWLGDQMNSVVTSFLDFGYFICFFTSQVEYFGSSNQFVNFKVYGDITRANGAPDPEWDACYESTAWWRPILTAVPAMVRFLQCLRRYRDSPTVHPHLTNAGKYCTTFIVIIVGTARAIHDDVPTLQNPLFYLWVVSYICSFCYTYYWDLYMDWSLMQSNHGFLREELAYGKKWYYYFAIVQDGLLRLSWTLNVSLAAAGNFLGIPADLLLCVTGFLECFRRFVWNFIRLENEHVNNIGKFRAVRDISLKPIRKGALEGVLDRMDKKQGVTHRGAQMADKMKRPKDPKAKQEKKEKKIRISEIGQTARKKVSFWHGKQAVGDISNNHARSSRDSLDSKTSDVSNP